MPLPEPSPEPTSDSATRPTARAVLPPLLSCAYETERHVAAAGWDQPLRLFALVDEARLLAAEPGLREHLGASAPEEDPLADDPAAVPAAYAAVEQEDLPDADGVEGLLARLAWPKEVDGVAVVLERIVVPPEVEDDLPADPEEATTALLAHPLRQDIRLLVAVTRDGDRACLVRQRAHDHDDEVGAGEDLAPGLIAALAATLRD